VWLVKAWGSKNPKFQAPNSKEIQNPKFQIQNNSQLPPVLRFGP
jgi:hypothetical protein